MLRRTAVQWIQSNDDQNWFIIMFVQIIVILRLLENNKSLSISNMIYNRLIFFWTSGYGNQSVASHWWSMMIIMIGWCR
jgi:hypothetical protein